MSSTATSPELIELIRKNDPEGWFDFVDNYTPSIYGWSRELGASPEDAADVVQIVILKVFINVDEFQPKNFRGWLWTITKNSTTNLVRKKNKQAQASGGTSNAIRIHHVPDPVFDDSDPGSRAQCQSTEKMLAKWNEIMKFVETNFSEKQKLVFKLTLVEGLNSSEAAQSGGGQRLGLTADNIRKIKSRVVKRCHEMLGGQ